MPNSYLFLKILTCPKAWELTGPPPSMNCLGTPNNTPIRWYKNQPIKTFAIGCSASRKRSMNPLRDKRFLVFDQLTHLAKGIMISVCPVSILTRTNTFRSLYSRTKMSLEMKLLSRYTLKDPAAKLSCCTFSIIGCNNSSCSFKESSYIGRMGFIYKYKKTFPGRGRFNTKHAS